MPERVLFPGFKSAMITNRKEKLKKIVKKEKEKRQCYMAAKEKKTEGKKSFKQKFHDYCMRQSHIAPIGLNDKEDKYYHSIFNFEK